MMPTRGLQRRCSERIACLSRGIETLDGLYTWPAIFVRVKVYMEAVASDSSGPGAFAGYQAPPLLLRR